MLIGVGVGGEYDLQARLVARHIGKHIPGNPNVVPQNMTGGGGLKMANFLFALAPRDGTHIGMLANNFPADPGRRRPGRAVRRRPIPVDWHDRADCGDHGALAYDRGKDHRGCAAARIRGRRLRDAAPSPITFPRMMNELLGTKFKIVTGYAGGNEINLAMERGEVQARNNTWSSWKATKREWLSEKKITIIAQAGPRAADLEAPSVEQLARNDEERQLIELVVSGTQLGRPLATTPGVPEERVKALRAAFDATMKDPEFLAEAAKLNFEVAPVAGEAMQRIVGKVLSTPKPLAARAKHLLE